MYSRISNLYFREKNDGLTYLVMTYERLTLIGNSLNYLYKQII